MDEVSGPVIAIALILAAVPATRPENDHRAGQVIGTDCGV
jgi:hypothetical protein